jgi:hypothetical protein
VWGKLEGSINNSNIPFAPGAGASAVIATTQSVAAGFLPLTGGTLTGPLTAASGVTVNGGLSAPSSNVVLGKTSVNGVSTNLPGGGPFASLASVNTTNAGSAGIAWQQSLAPTNQQWWDALVDNGTFSLRTVSDDGQTNNVWLGAARSGLTVTGITSNSGTGAWAHTGSFTTTGNVNVQGNLSSASNTQPAGPTNSGVALGGNPNFAVASFYDQTRAANNRTADVIFIGGLQTLRFRNDAGDTAIPWLSATGGFASGITGITSNSGTGAWVHTGNFTTTGQITALPGGGNGVQITGTNSTGVPTITTFGAASNITLSIGTKGAAPVQVAAQFQALSGATVTGNISATGQGTMPVYGNTGTAFNAQHMTVGYQALAGGTATVTFSGVGAFTSATSYVCTATDSSGSAAVMAQPLSGTSLTLSGNAADTIGYQCVGN